MDPEPGLCPLLGAVAVLALLAGCAQAPSPAAPVPSAPPPPAPLEFLDPVPLLDCEGGCYEPTVAARADGLVVALLVCGPRMAVSTDAGATFREVDLPPPPEPLFPDWTQCDNAAVFDDAGRLFYSSLVLYPGPASSATRPLAGVQVARSDDGGATWPANHHFSLAQGLGGAVVSDRQWVAARGDAVVVVYAQVGVGLFAAWSTDGGATFGPFAEAVAKQDRRYVTPSGPPAFGADGTVFLPYFAGAAPPAPEEPLHAEEVRVARSTDRGATWESAVVHAGAPLAVGYWPVVVPTPGGVAAAWSDTSGALMVATSADGGSWESPVRWNPEGDFAFAPPALRARGQGFDLFWYARSEAGHTPSFLRAAAPGTGDLVRFETVAGGSPPTDFASAAHLGERAVVAWSDFERGAWLALERVGS